MSGFVQSLILAGFSGVLAASGAWSGSAAQASTWQPDFTESVFVPSADLDCPVHFKISSEFNGSKLGFANRRFQLDLKELVDDSQLDILENELNYRGFLKGHYGYCTGEVDFSNRDFQRKLSIADGVVNLHIKRRNGEPLFGSAVAGVLVYEAKNVLRNPPTPIKVHASGIDPQAQKKLPGDQLGTRMVAYKRNFWQEEQIIEISFLNGSTADHNRIMQLAKRWQKYANIRFLKVNHNRGDIRVRVPGRDNADPFNHSMIGNQSANYSFSSDGRSWFEGTGGPSMSLAVMDSDVILHELGHAIGLQHEHQSPRADIPWNKEVVYRDMWELYGFDREKVDRNVFNKHTDAAASEYDPDSIMNYDWPASWTLDGTAQGRNLELSEWDEYIIGFVYPLKWQGESCSIAEPASRCRKDTYCKVQGSSSEGVCEFRRD